MRRRTWAALALGLALAAGCRSSQGVDAEAAETTLFHNGRIYLGAPDWVAVEAVLVAEGRVVAVGPETTLLEMSPTRRVDLRGGFAVPGLQDAHGHLEGHGKSLETVDLRGSRSFAEVVERVAAQAERQPRGTWIEGRAWDQNLWPEKAFPHHGELSRRVPDHPVWLRRVDGHAALANARALEIAGLDGPQPDEHPVPGGQMILGEDRRPTGVFVDTAMGLVGRHIPEPDEATRTRRILLAQDALLADGLTAIHDMGVDPATIHILKRLRDQGRLRLRLIEYLHGNAGLSDERIAGLPLAADADDLLCATGVKLVIDGALGSRGAALIEDYSDDPGNRGLLLLSVEDLAERLEICSRAGLQPAIHAIGDRGNRLVLDAYAELMQRRPKFARLRPRLEHAQIVAPEDWDRFAELGVIPSMQPTHCTSDMPWVPDRIGDERTRGAYVWRNLDSARSPLAFGSDFPVEAADPLEGLYAAVTRQTKEGQPLGGWAPDQKLDIRDALAGFTLGAAYAVHQEDRRGRLDVGWFADMTVLDVDPLDCDPTDLLRASVTHTVVNGRVVHRAVP